MKPRMRAALVAVFVIQLIVPVMMIRSAERTITDGRPFRFQTIPVDPVDLFHGRYVALQFAETRGPGVEGETLEWGTRAYAVIEEDADGFATIARVQEGQPDTADYLTVRVRGSEDGEVRFDFPARRFYMEESIAPAAEAVYRERSPGRTWARIRVRNGHAVIEDVLIDSVPLKEAAERYRDERAP